MQERVAGNPALIVVEKSIHDRVENAERDHYPLMSFQLRSVGDV